jgi:hypothetical protein
MRVNGRVLRPSNLAERRVLAALGVESLRVPRGVNPYIVARKVTRLGKLTGPDGDFLRALVTQVQSATN